MDYLPRTDEGLSTWAQNASAQISANPTSFGLTAGTASSLASLTTTYKDAVLAARDPLTRGSSSVFAKRQAKQALIDFIRPMVLTVQGTATVTPQMKHDLGITVRGENLPTPINAPQDAPAAEVAEMNGWMVKIKVRPAGSEGRSSRAPGAAMIHIYTYVGATPPGNVNDYKFEGASSRSVFEVLFDDDLAIGTRVWVCCQWVTARGLTSPACAPIGLLIGGGVPEVTAG